MTGRARPPARASTALALSLAKAATSPLIHFSVSGESSYQISFRRREMPPSETCRGESTPTAATFQSAALTAPGLLCISLEKWRNDVYGQRARIARLKMGRRTNNPPTGDFSTKEPGKDGPR